MNDSFVIETENLTKRYGADIIAVNGVNIRIRHGEVYGFLGPNGAGKTTTLRMLLGLIHPTSGKATVLGYPPGASAGLAKIGALVESPAFYPFLSGRDNLKVLARHTGVSEAGISGALGRVDLADRGDDDFETYSTGMKQRLGVAAALIKDPELLILDEPTSGLDPAGMAEMRQLIRDLGHGDRTVILSSHLMTEVEQICDRAGIIRKGAFIREGTIAELRPENRLRVRADPLEQARDIATRLECVEDVQTDGETLLITTCPEGVPHINQALVEAGVLVHELHMTQPSLEEVFLELTREGDDPR